MIPPQREKTHDVFTNHGRVSVSSASMAAPSDWEVSKPTSYAEPDEDQDTAKAVRAGGSDVTEEQRSPSITVGGVSAQLKHEYSVHAEPATQLSADDLAEVIRASGSANSALFQIKVLEWVKDGTVSVEEGDALMDALGSEQNARRLGAHAVMMRHGGGAAAAEPDGDGDGVAGLTDEAVAGLSEDDVRCLAAWTGGGGGGSAATTGAQAAEQRVLDAQRHPTAPAAPEGGEGGAEIPPMDRLLWGEPSVYPSAPDAPAGEDAGTAKRQKREDGLNELLAIAAAPLAVGAVTILGSLLVGRPLR